MSMCAAVDAFRKDPVGFMRANIVLPVLTRQGSYLPSGRYWATLEPIVMISPPTDPDGHPAGAFNLVLGETRGESSFRVFWCGYEGDAAHDVTVTDKADYLFTVTRNGCSLGVGSRPRTARGVKPVPSGART
jgi:hypothetical protein